MRRLAVLVVVLGVGLTATACVFPYYMQAIGGQVSLLRQRIPITEVVQDSTFPATTRQQLELVLDIREFAVAELDLPENDSYTSYVDLGRDYVVFNVIAAEEFSIEPMTWCFPVAGCVSYRGYFDRDKAQSFAAKLSADGYDIFTGGSPAYSTLGHFADPVLNTMLDRGETNIATTLFHELAHQRLYIKGDTQLSESFATAVEQFAVTLWLQHRSLSDELVRYRERLRREQDFAELVARQRDRLQQIYADDTDASQLRQAKQAAFDRMREEYQSLRTSWGGNGDYDAWFAGELNNAKLAGVTSYQRWVPGLLARLTALGPAEFYLEVEALAEQPVETRTATLDAWNAGRVVANRGLPTNGDQSTVTAFADQR